MGDVLTNALTAINPVTMNRTTPNCGRQHAFLRGRFLLIGAMCYDSGWWRTFPDVLGAGSEQVDDVEMLSHVDQDLQLAQQRLHLVQVTQICNACAVAVKMSTLDGTGQQIFVLCGAYVGPFCPLLVDLQSISEVTCCREDMRW